MSAADSAAIEPFFAPDAEQHNFRFVSADKQRPDSRPLYLLRPGRALPQAAKTWLAAQGFSSSSGAFALLPDASGGLGGAVFGLGAEPEADNDADFFSSAAAARSPFILGDLSAKLPAGSWHFAAESLPLLHKPFLACLGMILGSYHFRLGKGEPVKQIEFTLPENVDKAALIGQAEAVFLIRNLINLPANLLSCTALERAALSLAARFGAQAEIIKGEALLKANLPLIHAVGRAGSEEPRLVHLSSDKSPHQHSGAHIALVGKGVCFDTGGLDIKSAAGMRLMKKDMGGAAHMLGLAQLIMAAKLPVKLDIYLPIVENSVSGNAFRPGDILPSRKGLTVEVGNTDAEGRLILADALALADESAPDILLDMATLTGAARVALGPDIPPFYSSSRNFTARLSAKAAETHDPLWQLPLWQAYGKNLSSHAADLNNISQDGFAGSIIAALFLSRFVSRAKIWAHCDIYGWRPQAAPGFPEGGDAQGIRALFALLQEKFS